MTPTDAKRTFAELMVKARTGQLTTADWRKLTEARQMLRRAKRPAMNPRKKSYLGDGYRKIWFSGRGGTTAGLVLSEQTFQNTRSVEAFSRLFPHTEMHKMARFHESPVFATWEEAFAYPTTAKENPKKPKKVFDVVHSGQTTRFFKPSEAKRFLKRHPDGTLDAHRIGERKGPVVSLARWRNPISKIVRIGRAEEVRYHRTIGSQPGYYKHEIRSRRAGVYTIPAGWVYVGSKSILITEGTPRV